MRLRELFWNASLPYVVLILVFAGTLLSLIADLRQDEFIESQQQMAQTATRGLTQAIQNLIEEERHMVQLFASSEGGLLRQLLLRPGDDHLHNRLESRVAAFFPGYAGFTLTDARGQPLLDDFAGYIDAVNQNDLVNLADPAPYLIRVPLNPDHHHLDLMVEVDTLPAFLLVSFPLDRIDALINAVQLHDYGFALVNTARGGLIELVSAWVRDELVRDGLLLTMDEQPRVSASESIAGSVWQLVAIRRPGLISGHWQGLVANSLVIFSSLLVVCLFLLGIMQRGEWRRVKAERRLHEAKEHLEGCVALRTRELCESKELAEVTLKSIGEGVVTTDEEGMVTGLNPAAEALTGWIAEHAKGRPITKIFKLADEISGKPVEDPVTRCLREQDPVEIREQAVILKRRGGPIAIQDSAAPIRDREERLVGVVMVFRDVTEARELAREIAWRASHDALTGLQNRSEFERELQLLLDTAEQDSGQHTLLFMDLDQFKVVNDTCGHVAGDELLRQLTTVLKNGVRESDTLARLGGDEFALLLEYCPLQQALRLAEQLRESVRDFRFTWEGKTFTMGISIGMVPLTPLHGDLTRLLSAADSACYAAKDAGRNRIHVYSEDNADMEQRMGEMQWVSRLHHALDENRFRLYGQKIIPVGRWEQGMHIEVLIRMVDESGGLVPPGAFIPAAERYSLMPSIDRVVVRDALDWLTSTPALAQQVACCAINLSGHSLADPGFFDYLSRQIAHYRIDPRKLCFEITETATIANLSSAQQFIAAIKRLGCRFALDDFGSGMSSFAYLKNLPVDFLKIDGEFVKDVVTDPISHAMVKTINQIGHIMGKQTIAEYVENEEILAMMKHIGVDYAQGYGIAKPCPLDALADLQLPGRISNEPDGGAAQFENVAVIGSGRN